MKTSLQIIIVVVYVIACGFIVNDCIARIKVRKQIDGFEHDVYENFNQIQANVLAIKDNIEKPIRRKSSKAKR